MRWLVEPLVAAGFRVIAVDHHGNNYVDGYEPEGFLFVWERPRDLTFVLDMLADEQPLGPVGAAGFSVGGYTVAALAGARLDPQRVAAALTGRAPLPPIPEFPGVLAALRQKVAEDVISAAVNAAGADVSDSRVRAAFQVAPGIGSLLTPESLRAVPIPVEIRWGGADTIMTFGQNIRPYLENISRAAAAPPGPKSATRTPSSRSRPTRAMRSRVGADAAGFFREHLTDWTAQCGGTNGCLPQGC